MSPQGASISDFDINELVNTPGNFVAGQISDYLHVWEGITEDQWVLDQIKGVKLPFVSKPVQKAVPKPYTLKKGEVQKIDVQIQRMCSKGVVELTEHFEGEWISNIFPRPKPDGTV